MTQPLSHFESPKPSAKHGETVSARPGGLEAEAPHTQSPSPYTEAPNKHIANGLKINPEYESLLPSLATEQYDVLKKSIMEEGQHYPVAYNSDFEILDGHNRFKICQELGIEPLLENEPRKFATKLDEKQFVLETNLLRRHLPDFQRIIAGKSLLLVYRLKAEQRRKATQLVGKGIQQQDVMVSQNFAEPISEGKAIEQYAKAVHSNPETVRQALWLEEHGTPNKIEAVKNGEKTIFKAYAETRRDLKPKAETPPFPDGKYRTIIIDPPWESKMVLKEVRPNQVEFPYPTMRIEEIMNLPINDLAVEEGCHVYLWTTHKYLPDALKIFEHWGVKYQCLLTWVKPVGISPFSWMYDTEHALFGRIGNLDLLKMGVKLSFNAPVTRHSEKPEVFYEKVKEVSPEPRLEMFQRKPHEGFKGWGNEAEKESS